MASCSGTGAVYNSTMFSVQPFQPQPDSIRLRLSMLMKMRAIRWTRSRRWDKITGWANPNQGRSKPWSQVLATLVVLQNSFQNECFLSPQLIVLFGVDACARLTSIYHFIFVVDLKKLFSAYQCFIYVIFYMFYTFCIMKTFHILFIWGLKKKCVSDSSAGYHTNRLCYLSNIFVHMFKM